MEVIRTRFCKWCPKAIESIAVAPRGAAEPRLALGRHGGSVELWDTSTWHLVIASPCCDRASVRCLAWTCSDDSEGEGLQPRLFSSGLDKSLIEWDPRTLQRLLTLESGGGPVWAMAASEKRLLVACEDGTVRWFSLGDEPGGMMFQRRVNVGVTRLLSMAEFGDERIFVGGCQSEITRWHLPSLTCDAKMKVEEASDAQTLVWTLACVDQRTLVSGDSLGLVLVWDAHDGILMHRFQKHQGDVFTLAASGFHGAFFSGGLDKKISVFVKQTEGEVRWVHSNSHFGCRHDVKALAVVDREVDDPNGAHFFAWGGTDGELRVQHVKVDPNTLTAPPLICPGFSPLFQKGMVAQTSRTVLCQRDNFVELWHVPRAGEEKPALPGASTAALMQQSVDLQAVNARFIARIKLKTAAEGHHILASAIAPNGRLIAISDAAGTRLFHHSIKQLQVRQKSLPEEARRTVARALAFCGRKLHLAMADWNTGQLLLVNTASCSVVASFDNHTAVVPHLVGSTNWLASADVEGKVHVFDLSRLEHHARLPKTACGSPATALAFDPGEELLYVAFSSHAFVAFELNEAMYAEGFPHPMTIPEEQLWRHQRVCGIATCAEAPEKVVLWGHDFLLKVEFRVVEVPVEEPSSSKGPKRRLVGTCDWSRIDTSDCEMRHIICYTMLEQKKWGDRLITHALHEAHATRRGGVAQKRSRLGVDVLALSMEVTKEAVKESLPAAFETKRYLKKRRRRY